MKIHTALSLTALAFAACPAAAGAANTSLHRAPVLATARPPLSVQVPENSPHRYFGLMQAANGTALIVRLRNGHDLHVDASQAFSLTRVSEPLFSGKPVVVRGTYAPGGIFRATSVQKASMRQINWGLDS